MAVTTNNQVIINKITKALYDANVANGTITAEEITNQVWIFTDSQYVSAADITKLAGIETGAEVNIIEEIKVNGETVSPDAKIVNIVVPTKTSDLTNDSGFITADDIPDVTETDPTVPAWAKAASKPTYTYAEIAEKPELFSGNYNDLTNKPTIPSVEGLASESYVNQKVADLVNSAPTTLDTLGEVATAIQNNASVVEALNSAIGNKANASDVTALATRVSTAESDIDALQTGKADASAIPTKLSDLTNDLNLSAYENKIESIKVNGVAQTIGADKSVDLAVHSHSNSAVLNATTASFTTELKGKIDGVEAGAEVNVVETVKVNGVALTPSNKAVDIEVPTCKTRIWS